jgi:hypothetical protein
MHGQAPGVAGKDAQTFRWPCSGLAVLIGKVCPVIRPRLDRSDSAATVQKERSQVANAGAHFQNVSTGDGEPHPGKMFKSPRVHPQISGNPECVLRSYHGKYT